MAVEVSWRDIKNTCSRGCSIAQFLGALCKFIRTVLGEEHMQRLVDAGTPNDFISGPQPTKAMHGAVQEMHPKTLSTCFMIEMSTRLRNPRIIFRDLMEVIMESVPPNAPLHVKIAAAHEDRIREGATPTFRSKNGADASAVVDQEAGSGEPADRPPTQARAGRTHDRVQGTYHRRLARPPSECQGRPAHLQEMESYHQCPQVGCNPHRMQLQSLLP